jgi:hypothetical protein
MDLPNELLLEIFSFLPLKSLISARFVNQRWRQLVPKSDLLPARRALYALYYHVINHPNFLNTREATLSVLGPKIDREGLISLWEGCGVVVLPEEFKLWLLEWPEKAVFGWMWPRLDVSLHRGGNVEQRWGFNTDLELEIIDFTTAQEEDAPEHAFALCVKCHGYRLRSHVMIVIDRRQVGSKFHGTVHNIYGKDFEEYESSAGASWTSWLRDLLDKDHGNSKVMALVAGKWSHTPHGFYLKINH